MGKTRQKLYQLEGRAEKEREVNTQLVRTRSSVCNLAVFCTRMSAGFVPPCFARDMLEVSGHISIVKKVACAPKGPCISVWLLLFFSLTEPCSLTWLLNFFKSPIRVVF